MQFFLLGKSGTPLEDLKGKSTSFLREQAEIQKSWAFPSNLSFSISRNSTAFLLTTSRKKSPKPPFTWWADIIPWFCSKSKDDMGSSSEWLSSGNTDHTAALHIWGAFKLNTQMEFKEKNLCITNYSNYIKNLSKNVHIIVCELVS